MEVRGKNIERIILVDTEITRKHDSSSAVKTDGEVEAQSSRIEEK